MSRLRPIDPLSPPLVESPNEAAENIRLLNTYLSKHPGIFNQSLRRVRRWYAIWQNDNGWMIGFSKFIGYSRMTGERYRLYTQSNKTDREKLDGGETERKDQVLWTSSIPMDDSHLEWPEVSATLKKFLERQGLKSPRSDATIRVLNGYGRA